LVRLLGCVPVPCQLYAIAISKLANPGVVHVRIDLHARRLVVVKTRCRDCEVAERHTLSGVVVRRDRREEVKHKFDIVRSDYERTVRRAEIGGGEGTRLDVVARAWYTEQTIRVAIDASHDGPCKLLAMVELSYGSWQIRSLVTGEPC